jgi:hypothetical protein
MEKKLEQGQAIGECLFHGNTAFGASPEKSGTGLSLDPHLISFAFPANSQQQ